MTITMYSKNLMLFSSLFMVASFGTPAIAQTVVQASVAEPVSVTVTVLQRAPIDKDDVRLLFADILREELDLAGYSDTGKQQTNLVVSAIRVPDGFVAISVTMHQRLPQPIVDFAAQNEAFYLAFPAVERPKEGQHVRQYMSGEYMAQFEMLTDHYESLVEVSNLRQAARDVVAQLTMRYSDGN